MKKDKSVRKAEFKAAVIKQLKSMIGSMIILLVILAGVLVTIFYKTEKEPEEIIKVNAYEGETEPMVLENDRIKFTLDPKTTQFSVLVKSTGMVWNSTPDDAAGDPLALPADREKLQSTLVLTYSTINGVDTIYSNYAYSMKNQIYDIEKGEDYIKIYYSIGDTAKEFIIPTVIREDDYEELVGKLDQSMKVMISQYYKKYDINNLGKKEDPEQLLADYPILENEVVYILRSTSNDSVRLKFQQAFEEAGYTYEQYLEDKELDLSSAASKGPVFNVNMIYRLDGDDLIVEVPMDEIEYKDEYPILYLSVLPYFGAAGTEEQGFMFVPEGGGSIINFNNGKVTQNGYYANVYGWDMATVRTAVVRETRTYYNVFGMSKDENSFICIMEKGAPYAAIQADISGRNNSFNNVNAVYNITHREQYNVSDKYNGNMFVYEDSLAQESLINRYCFVDSGSYVDMANAYGQYLQNKYSEYFVLNDDAEAPVAVEIVGAVDKVTQVCGVPVSRPLRLTTYKEAGEIVQELKGEGFNNMSVKLSGWMNGGIQQKILKDVNLISDLGSKKTLKNFIANANENGIPVYLDGITNYAYDSNVFDGFFVFTDVARLVSKEKAEIYPYSAVTYSQRDSQDPHYLLKPTIIEKMVNNLTKTANDMGANVSFRDIGFELSSDFNREEPVSRQTMLESQAAQVKAIHDAGTGVMINMGNDYTALYADIVTNMDLSGSEYTIIDAKVPFYQIAVHGYLNYTGEALNLTQNEEEEILKSAEYGAGLYFTVMRETAFALQKTLYTEYFGADYSAWHDRMVRIYTRYNSELGHTFNQRMVNHELMTEKLSCTTYEDGTKVYVNYNYEDCVTNDGKKVPARDYLVVR